MLPANGWLTPELFSYADVIAAPLPEEFHAHYFENFRRYYTTQFNPPAIVEAQSVRASVESEAGTNDGGLTYGWDVILVISNTYSALLVDTIYAPTFPDHAVTEGCVAGEVVEEVCPPEAELTTEDNLSTVYVSDDADVTAAINDYEPTDDPNYVSDSLCDSSDSGRDRSQECW